MIGLVSTLVLGGLIGGAFAVSAMYVTFVLVPRLVRRRRETSDTSASRKAA